MRVFVMGYPGELGGACTELWHTIKLWRQFGVEVTGRRPRTNWHEFGWRGEPKSARKPSKQAAVPCSRRRISFSRPKTLG